MVTGVGVILTFKAHIISGINCIFLKSINATHSYLLYLGLGLWCLTPLSTVLHLYVVAP